MNNNRKQLLTFYGPLEAVKRDGLVLEFINNQSEEICEAAIRNNCRALRFVRKQSEKLSLLAVNKSGLAIKYVNVQTPAICLAAVKNDVNALFFIKDQTEEICKMAIDINGYFLRYVKKQTPELCLAAIVTAPKIIKEIDDRILTHELCIKAVRINPACIEFIDQIRTYADVVRGIFKIDRIRELCLEAVKRNGFMIAHVKEQTEDLCLEAVKQNGFAIQYVRIQTHSVCLEAVKQNGLALQYVWRRTHEIVEAALRQNGWAIQCVTHQRVVRWCLIALRSNEDSIVLIVERDRNKVATTIITEICLALYSLRLPAYVLLWIIDWVLYDNTLKHKAKIDQIARIVEKQLPALRSVMKQTNTPTNMPSV